MDQLFGSGFGFGSAMIVASGNLKHGFFHLLISISFVRLTPG
jgi:hypothetical protein